MKKKSLDIIEWIFIFISLAMFLYHMVSTQYLFFGSFEHQNIHLFFLLTLVFFNAMRTHKKGWVRGVQGIFIVLSIAATVYVYVNMEQLEAAGGYPEFIDVVIGLIIMFLVTEGTRQAWGVTLPIVCVIFVAYFFLGHMIPGPLHHRPFNFDFVISYLCIGLTGVYGTFLSISANMIFLFVVFGALMKITRVNDLLFEAGKLAGRFLQGGPAQTAVVSSSLVGMVTGAAVANVTITGAFTIPFMKKVGYKPELAGAIEATASTGGQLMPPIMGAAAFLMAFFVGVPYAEVMLAGILPALFFYLAVIISVQLISVANNINPPTEKPDYSLILRRLPLFIIPLSVIIVFLLLRYSPMVAAFWAITAAIFLGYLSKETRPTLMELAQGISSGVLTGAKIGVSLCVVGMIAQTLITTGLGAKIAGLVEVLSGGNLMIALMITMVVAIILGCGVPPVAAYALVAIVVAPTLVNMGVPTMSAHFFCFYFAIISAVTPPVALGSLAAAGIAEASYFKTAINAFKLAISGFLIPYLIVYNPILNLHVESVLSAIGALIAIPIALVTLSAFIYNVGLIKLSRIERFLSLCIAVFMFIYCTFGHLKGIFLEYLLFAAGLTLFIILLSMQFRKKRKIDEGKVLSETAKEEIQLQT